MPTIKISDSASVELLTATAGPGSGISKYFKGQNAFFLASSELALAMNKPLASLEGPIGAGMSLAAAGEFGATGIEWKLNVGAAIGIESTPAGNKLSGYERFGSAIVTPSASSFLSVSFTPTLSLSAAESIGDLRFGFNAGGSVAFRMHRAFPDSGASAPSIGAALKSILTTGIVPGNILDIASMDEGDVASVSGSGNLKFSASFNVAQILNPLASPSIPVVNAGQVALKAGASLKVGASVGISGSYQIRIHKLPGGIVRLGFHKLNASQFQFAVDASLGLSATAGKREVLSSLVGMLGGVEADVVALVDAGLSDAQIDSLKAAVKASLDRSLAVSLAASFSSSSSTSSVFEYEFDMAALGADGVSAFNRALRGDLSSLTEKLSTNLPAGVKLVSSELETVKSKKSVWKLNLLGIVNVLRVSELIAKGKVLFNADTGELVVTDSISAKKISVESRPFEAETKSLHKLLLQSLVFTAAWRASGTEALSQELSASMTWFEQVANASLRNISNFLDNLVATELIFGPEKNAFLTNTAGGRSSIFLDARFNDACFNALFFDAAGNPRPEADYDAIGRAAVAAIVVPGDEQDFRRLPMLAGNPGSDKLWNDMSGAGPAALHTVLPPGLKEGVPLAIIRHDYIVIKWWSESMAKAAKAAAAMRQFLNANASTTPETLKNDPAFLELRKKLVTALTGIASDSLPDFLDAWGIAALDAASNRRAELTGILLTPGPILVKTRP
jgi:hypothetical protein